MTMSCGGCSYFGNEEGVSLCCVFPEPPPNASHSDEQATQGSERAGRGDWWAEWKQNVLQAGALGQTLLIYQPPPTGEGNDTQQPSPQPTGRYGEKQQREIAWIRARVGDGELDEGQVQYRRMDQRYDQCRPLDWL